jgi:hypothetical protein
MADTDYVVLRKDPQGAWQFLDRVHARSAAAAAIHVAGDQLDQLTNGESVELRAINARAWETGHTHLKAQHQTRIVQA